jgi:hypothetical protein
MSNVTGTYVHPHGVLGFDHEDDAVSFVLMAEVAAYRYSPSLTRLDLTLRSGRMLTFIGDDVWKADEALNDLWILSDS